MQIPQIVKILSGTMSHQTPYLSGLTKMLGHYSTQSCLGPNQISQICPMPLRSNSVSRQPQYTKASPALHEQPYCLVSIINKCFQGPYTSYHICSMPLRSNNVSLDPSINQQMPRSRVLTRAPIFARCHSGLTMFPWILSLIHKCPEGPYSSSHICSMPHRSYNVPSFPQSILPSNAVR